MTTTIPARHRSYSLSQADFCFDQDLPSEFAIPQQSDDQHVLTSNRRHHLCGPSFLFLSIRLPTRTKRSNGRPDCYIHILVWCGDLLCVLGDVCVIQHQRKLCLLTSSKVSHLLGPQPHVCNEALEQARLYWDSCSHVGSMYSDDLLWIFLQSSVAISLLVHG